MTTDLVAALAHGVLPPHFTRTTVVIPPGRSVAGSAGTWQKALVLLISGRIRVVPSEGPGGCFETGAILALEGLDRCRIENPGGRAAVLVAVVRT